MLKLFKNLTKKDLGLIGIVFVLIVFSVFLDLRMPEYMSQITRLVQTEDSTLQEILKAGSHMYFSFICKLF